METNKDFLAMKMLAEQGNVQAIYGVGINYLEGVYTPKDEKLGISYVEKTAELGNIEVVNTLLKNGANVLHKSKKWCHCNCLCS